jgi:hypothetical protein
MTNNNAIISKINIRYDEETEELLLEWDNTDPALAELDSWTEEQWIKALEGALVDSDQTQAESNTN